MNLALSVIPGTYAICRLPAGADVPLWPMQSAFFTISRTDDELSILCEERHVRSEEQDIRIEPGWRGIKLLGPIPFDVTGVIASLTRPLAESGISVSAIATYDTDYLFVKKEKLDAAVQALRDAGCEVLD